MRYLSLFSGIGGFDLAFQRAGMNCVGMVEIDKNCQGVLHKQFDYTHVYDDVKEINGSTFERGTVELVCGGFPCQDLSIAGKRAGLAGERSGLWFEFARVIDELESRWVVIENVPGLLSSDKGKDFAVIIQWLAERGYGVAWRVLDAQYFGVPQRRRRVFIVGSLGNGRATEVLFERESMSRDIAAGEETREGTATAALRGFGHGWQGQHNDTNAVISFTHEETPKFSIEFSGALDSTGQRRNSVCVARESGKGYWMEDDISGTLDKNMGDSGHASRPAILWEMQHASEAYRPSQGGVAPTLQQRMGTGGNNIPLVGVRRLTPTECERLQGFPDDWTQYAMAMSKNGMFYEEKEVEQKDSVRYKQLGNAVAVPVVEWIGKRIMEAENERS